MVVEIISALFLVGKVVCFSKQKHLQLQEDLQGFTYEIIGFHMQIMLLQTQKTLWISHFVGCWSTNDASNFHPSLGGFVPHPHFDQKKYAKVKCGTSSSLSKNSGFEKKSPQKVFENTISILSHHGTNLADCSLFIFSLLKILVPQKVYRTSSG